MRLTIFAFLLGAIFYSTAAFTQVSRWTDHKGTVHLEAIGPKGANNTNSPQPKPNALRPIERSFADMRLGDDESPFTGSKKGVRIGNNAYDGNFYSYSGALPEGATNMGVLFSTGRLALIMIEYLNFGPGGWEQLVKETTKNYGPALGDARTMAWNDGATLLTLQHEWNGSITVTLEDFAAMSKYSEQARAALPKF